MKTDKTSPLSIVDALTEGLGGAFARPWLIAIPAAIDLALWLAPRLTINNLVQRFLMIWEAFFRLGFGADQAAAADMVSSVREGMTQLAQVVNLANLITGSWFSMPSAVATIQSPRLTLISDVVMAPFGLGVKLKSVAPSPWQGQAIEINSFWVALLIVVGLWACSQLIAAFILRAAAAKPINTTGEQQNSVQPEVAAPPIRRWDGIRGLLALTVRLAVFTLMLAVVVFCLYLPLGLALLTVTGSGSSGAGMLFAMFGGLTLWMLMWLLTSLFFMSEALIVDGQPFGTSILASFRLTRQNGLRTLGLVALVNIILLGFRAVWGLAGQTPAGALVAIFGNAYLVTAMLLAVYAYFGDLKRRETKKAQKPAAGNNRQ
jgi:hypothetical protein